jgi:hypothetical protein
MSEIRLWPSFLCLNLILKGQTFIIVNKTAKYLQKPHLRHDRFILTFAHFMCLLFFYVCLICFLLFFAGVIYGSRRTLCILAIHDHTMLDVDQTEADLIHVSYMGYHLKMKCNWPVLLYLCLLDTTSVIWVMNISQMMGPSLGTKRSLDK